MRKSLQLFSLVALVALAGCEGAKAEAAASGSQSSPVQYGITAGLLVPVTEVGPADVYGVGSYEYSKWSDGHDDVFSLGLQARTPLAGGLWSVGGEAIYHRWICKSDALAGCGGSPAANGFGLNGVIVRSLPNSPIDLWASAGPKWLTDFTQNGTLAFESGFGWHAKVGVELTLGR